MNNEQNLLQVGDRIYSKAYNKWSGPVTITRVTKTRAFAMSINGNESAYDRNVSDRGCVYTVPRGTWRSETHYRLTEEKEKEVIAKMQHQARVDTLSRINWQVLPPESVEEIYELYKKAQYEASRREQGLSHE